MVLDQVVELDALSNDRAAQRGAVYRRIRTDLHMILNDDIPDLCNLSCSLNLRKPTIAANDHSECRVTIADDRIAQDAYAGMDQRPFSYGDHR